MERQSFINLLEKYINKKATTGEQTLLDEYYKRLDAMSDLQLSEQEEDVLQESILKKIQLQIYPKRSYRIWYAAASIVVILGIGLYLIQPKQTQPIVIAQKNEILPGSNKAVLTLGNGEQIVLTRANKGVLANQGGVQITKGENGRLSYQIQNNSTPTTYNTITVPRGGQYEVMLSDGSKVLLNAESSLTYPAQFKGKSRNVELKGEGYFEVAKDVAMPFVVQANDVEVHVLGTHFNISAYADDSTITTTLVEGAVTMNKGKTSKLLKPGQQGMATNNFGEIAVQNANMEQSMGWVNGNFVFKDLHIKEIMKIVARWYNIEVEYQGNVQLKKFGGTISRYHNITELLDYMKITGSVNYKIEGRRVILMN